MTTGSRAPGAARRLAARPELVVLAALAYLPALASSPGRMPADTKLYLYLDPGRLIADAPFSWDVRQFAGWVPHQTIAYLWPSGPWFWVFDRLGAPDWVAHRLWIGTILFLAGAGVRWAARHLGLGVWPAFVAGFTYQLSPYVLPYISRTSVMLLPWAAVGWMVGLTVRAAHGRTRWRDPALFALVVLTFGAVNATATALVAPAPVLWLVHAAWQRTITWGRAAVTAAKLGGLALLVSLWWIVMLVVQGRHGADVLAFSETLEAVSLTSTSTETLRGLGYWLFYVRDPYAFTTTASIPYMASGVVIAAGYAVTLIGLGGIALVRWSQRRYAAGLVFTGIVLAVGVHPIDDPSPLMAPLGDSALGLALRSSTRALPLFGLGIALGAGAAVSAVGAVRWRGRGVVRVVAPLSVCAVVLLALPALRHRQFVDPALERDQDVPAAWTAAAAALDAGSSEHRVLQLPGSEFGAFRWGYTVDPPLPGLTDKPLVTRDLLPLGSPGAMDLLYALDDRIQAGTLDPAALPAVARLLGVDTIWLANDLAFDRFRTPRPELFADLLADVDGLGERTAFGAPATNDPVIPMIDEQRLAEPAIGRPQPPVELVEVTDPQPIVRASSDVVVLAGSGDGVVDAAAAGLLDGGEAIVYAADLDEEVVAELPAGTPVIVTDSNRDRAAHWRGSQDVQGFTESGGPDPDVTRTDDADQRLAVFPDATGAEHQTVAVLEGGLAVQASGYGEPFAYRPEDRAAMAVDGDPSTAWVVADRADPVGESIAISRTDGALVLLQPQDPAATRRITRVLVDDGDGQPRPVVLTDASWSSPGQRVDVAAGVPVAITIDAVEDVPEGTDSGWSAVGFAELGPVATEVVRVPVASWPDVAEGAPLSIVLRRDRVRPTNRWRDDPERRMVREVDLPSARSFAATVTLRLHARARDELLAAWRGVAGAPLADRRLTGSAAAAGASATDGDLATAWTTPFGQAVGATLTVPLAPGTISALELHQPGDELHSRITAVRVRTSGGLDVVAEVPAPDIAGRASIPLPVTATAEGDVLTLTIESIEERTTVDRRYAEPTVLPAAVVELSGMPISGARPAALPTCRGDLLEIDGAAVPLAISPEAAGRIADGLAVDVPTCDGATVELPAGPRRITTAAGSTTGVDVDRVVLRSVDATPTAPAAGQPRVDVERSRTGRVATVAPCPTGCWLILGEGYNPAWAAEVDGGGALGSPTQISGGFNGWWLPPSDAPRSVTMTWSPQGTLNVALGLAALGVLACVVLALADRRVRAAVPAADVPIATSPFAPTSRRQAAVVAVVLALAGASVVAPAWGLVGLAVGVVALAWRRTGWIAWSAVALAGALAVVVLRRELASRFVVDAAWPGRFEDLHRAGMFVVVLALAGSLLHDRRGAEPVGEEHLVAGGSATEVAGPPVHERLRGGDHDDRLERGADPVPAVEDDGGDENGEHGEEQQPAPPRVQQPQPDHGAGREQPPADDAGP